MKDKIIIEDLEGAKLFINALFASTAIIGILAEQDHGDISNSTVVRAAWCLADLMTSEFVKRVEEAEAKLKANKPPPEPDEACF